MGETGSDKVALQMKSNSWKRDIKRVEKSDENQWRSWQCQAFTFEEENQDVEKQEKCKIMNEKSKCDFYWKSEERHLSDLEGGELSDTIP